MSRKMNASMGVQTMYVLRSVLADLLKRKFGTLLTIIVIAVFMQPQKNPSSNVFDGGGSEALFERSKPRGFEAFMQRFTGIMVFLWIVDAIVLSILSSK